MRKIGLFLMPYGQKMITAVVLILFIFNTILLAEEKVVFGITSVAFKEDMITMRQWSQYIEKHSGFKTELRFARSYDESQSMIENGVVDFAYVCGATFVALDQSGTAEILAVPLSHGKNHYYSLMITRKDKKIEKIIDLQDKIFAFGDLKSNSGTIVPAYNIMIGGYCPKNFFKRMIFTYDHGESIRAVLEGFADAASVDSLVYESFALHYPNEVAQLKIIERFGPYAITPVVVRKGLEELKKSALLDALRNMTEHPEGIKILKKLAIDGFVSDPIPDYAPIEHMMQYIKKSGL